MSVENERSFKSSDKFWICNKLFVEGDKFWICNKLFVEGDNKVKDDDHVTGKYRGSAYSNSNINLELTNKIPVMFHNFEGYSTHFIMQEIGKMNVKLSVIPNGLEN